MATLAEIYDWFMTGKKPTQAQFWASWGSFWNKGESIPQSAITGLPGVLNAKAEKTQFDAHKTDETAHAAILVEPNARITALEAKTDSENNFKTITGYSLNPATRILTMNARWEGVINGDDYTNVAAQELVPAIPLTAAGYSRIDLIVFGTDSLFVRVQGEPSLTTPGAPPLPPNTIEATFLTVSDGVVNAPVIPKPKAPVTSVQGMRGDVILNIINDLVTGGVTDFLSAEQGKVLKTQINAINTLLTSDNVNLDNVQELVDAIETIQTSLSTILVNDLTTGGTTKALTAEMGKTLKAFIDGLNTNKVDKVAGERLINAAEITKLAAVTNVTTTVKTITSASLATQDVAGFVAYINALAVVLVVGANEIVEYQLSDTGRLFKLLLRGRSFGVGQAAIVAANVLEVTEFLNKDIKLSNYPSTRNDGQLPTNKVLSTDVNGNLKMYTIATAPAPYLEILVPDSTLPSTTTNFVLKGAFFTPTMTVVIAGQTINYITFVSDNEVRVNVTTGAIEGSYSVTLDNGISATYNNALLIVLGTVYSFVSTDWKNITLFENVDGDLFLKTYNTNHVATSNVVFDVSKNFRVNFLAKTSPLCAASISIPDSNIEPTSFHFINAINGNIYLRFDNYMGGFRIRDINGTTISAPYAQNFHNRNNYLDFRYVNGVMYLYYLNVLVMTYNVPAPANLALKVITYQLDITNVKYIETA